MGWGRPLEGGAYVEYFVGGKILDIDFHSLEIGLRYRDFVLALNFVNTTYYQFFPGISIANCKPLIRVPNL